MKLTKRYEATQPPPKMLQHQTFEVDAVDCGLDDLIHVNEEWDDIGVVDRVEGNSVTLRCGSTPALKEGDELNTREVQNLTVLEMCQHIVDADLFRKEGDIKPGAEEVFEALVKPHNELFLVFDYYRKACSVLKREGSAKDAQGLVPPASGEPNEVSPEQPDGDAGTGAPK